MSFTDIHKFTSTTFLLHQGENKVISNLDFFFLLLYKVNKVLTLSFVVLNFSFVSHLPQKKILSMFFFLLNGFSLKKFDEMPMMNEKNNYVFLNLYAKPKNDSTL